MVMWGDEGAWILPLRWLMGRTLEGEIERQAHDLAPW